MCRMKIEINSIFRYLMLLVITVSGFGCRGSVIKVCSAENFYGDVAGEIGGRYVEVFNVISNPGADPHLFGVSSETAVKVSDAAVVIYNGAGYDPWMEQLLSAEASNNKLAVINVSEISGADKTGNPHIWYKPEVFPELARFLCRKFSAILPEAKAYFEGNLDSFNTRYSRVIQLVSSIRNEYSGTAVIATEPVFGYMSEALGFKTEGGQFQQVVMNGGDPSPKMTADFINLLKDRKVRILFYNNQVTGPSSEYILKTARESGIPVAGVSETLPEGKHVTEWLAGELDEIIKILKTGSGK